MDQIGPGNLTPAERSRSLEFLTDRLRESNRELAEVKQSLRHLETTLDCIEHWNQEIAKELVAMVEGHMQMLGAVLKQPPL